MIEVRKEAVTTHGLTQKGERPSEYNIWSGLIQRCTNSHEKAFNNYGGRGITVCQRWQENFLHFYHDMGPRPSPKHTLDRIDNNQGYIPENCRWATRHEQANNKRNNHFISFEGQTQTLTQWAGKIGITSSMLQGRLRNHWPLHLALTAPAGSRLSALLQQHTRQI